MAILNFNATEISPATTLEAIPAGRYQVVNTDSELKMTKNGSGSYLELTFEIISGELGMDTKDDVAYILAHDPGNPENRDLPELKQ